MIFVCNSLMAKFLFCLRTVSRLVYFIYHLFNATSVTLAPCDAGFRTQRLSRTSGGGTMQGVSHGFRQQELLYRRFTTSRYIYIERVCRTIANGFHFSCWLLTTPCSYRRRRWPTISLLDPLRASTFAYMHTHTCVYIYNTGVIWDGWNSHRARVLFHCVCSMRLRLQHKHKLISVRDVRLKQVTCAFRNVGVTLCCHRSTGAAPRD